MILMLLIGLALFGYACWLVLKAVGLRRARVGETLAGMRLYGFQGKSRSASESAPPSVAGAVNNLATSVGELVATRTHLMREEELSRELRSAGMYSTSVLRFMGYRVLAGITLPLLWLWVSLSGHSSGARTVLGMMIAFAVGWQGPLILVRRNARFRLEEIDYQMPELIDVL